MSVAHYSEDLPLLLLLLTSLTTSSPYALPWLELDPFQDPQVEFSESGGHHHQQSVYGYDEMEQARL